MFPAFPEVVFLLSYYLISFQKTKMMHNIELILEWCLATHVFEYRRAATL